MNTTPETPETNDDALQPAAEAVANARLHEREIMEEMQTSYIDYAMMTIIGRALPDARDGLKPVHRRILYTMHRMGLHSGGKFAKSARIVGDVMGKLHPHGDSAIYEALVRLAQPFSLRDTLIRGQGNFGSIDGDSAAAMRYTEAKLETIAAELLADIDSDTVDWKDNYDGSLKEPAVLPTRVPNLLLNGSMGIAVGMATNIPPHNLGELIAACRLLIAEPEATVEKLCTLVKGPDFPTGGHVYNATAIQQAYATGRGSVVLRGEAVIEEREKGSRSDIIITQIPYNVIKSDLIAKIAELVKDGRIEGISGIRDLSAKGDIRVVIECKKDAYPAKIRNQLFKLTNLQVSFSYNMTAVVDGGRQPQVLGLKDALEIFLAHRKEVVIRRTEHLLREARAREHILEGLTIALDHIDAIIALIRASKDKDEAREGLITRFGLSVLQADAILQMRLQTLAGLERQKIYDELAAIRLQIADYVDILASSVRLWGIIDAELEAVANKYATPRITQIHPEALESISALDTIPNEAVVISITHGGYIKRTIANEYRRQHRGGKGVKGMATKDEDEVRLVLHTRNHDNLLFFTSMGKVYQLPVYQLPQAGRAARGQAVVNVLNLTPGEKVLAVLSSSSLAGQQYLLFATRHGIVKKTALSEYERIMANGKRAINLRDGDELLGVASTTGTDDILIFSRQGQAVRFAEDDIRDMGRTASGVIGMRLKSEGDEVVGMAAVPASQAETSMVVTVTSGGFAKRSPLPEYRRIGRGGSGILTADLSKKTGVVVASFVVPEGMEGDVLVISAQGQTIRTPLNNVPERGRVTQGVYVMRLDDGDTVASTSLVPVDPLEDAAEDAAEAAAPAAAVVAE